MIVGNIKHPEFLELNRNFRDCLTFMKNLAASDVVDGTTKIINADCKAYYQEYKTVDASQKDFESHRINFDIQCVVDGEEKLLVYPQWKLINKTSFDENKDIVFYQQPNEKSTEIILRKGDFAIVSPVDGHKPGIKVESSVDVKKVVIKVPAV